MVFLKYTCIKFFLLLTIGSFAQNATITGRFEGAVGKEMVYIFSNKGISDSTHVHDKDFKFSLNTDGEWDVYFIKCPAISESFMFPVLAKENSQINVKFDKALTGIIISGDENAREQNSFYQGLTVASSRYWRLHKKMVGTKDVKANSELSQQLEEADLKVKEYYINWVKNHPKSPFSVAVLRMFIFKNSLKEEDTVAQKCFDSLSQEAIENNYQAEPLTGSFSYFNDRYAKIKLNESAPDFTIHDTLGNNIRLKDFTDSYLLIDFWASWCAPCRINNPLLKELHQQYKQKGLHVLSISVDTDGAMWRKAIQKDKMNWFQGSDLLGQNGGVALQYHITAVPFYVLLDPDGTVIFKSMGGDINMVESKLKSIFNN